MSADSQSRPTTIAAFCDRRQGGHAIACLRMNQAANTARNCVPSMLAPTGGLSERRSAATGP